jgi:hypothetical protein
MNLRVFAVIASPWFPRCAHAASAGGGGMTSPPSKGISEYRLDNGLRVVLFPDAGSPSTSRERHVTSSAPVTRSTARPGLGDLLEHMLFHRARKRAGKPSVRRLTNAAACATTARTVNDVDTTTPYNPLTLPHFFSHSFFLSLSHSLSFLSSLYPYYSSISPPIPPINIFPSLYTLIPPFPSPFPSLPTPYITF